MRINAINETIQIVLNQLVDRTAEAALIAKAASQFAGAGRVSDAVSMASNIEQILFEANRLQDTANLLNSIAKEQH